ncbi:hypothetical protein PIB30_079792 [Stylosanthes scabra]|uniref:Uncharacterized protein n=1 Tax=Stylosanthes scabra TaxID=79078 RepID=A0ABU6SRC5_9FABA|nr:hypothetical protein [Stylosanthes scabra]
MNVHYKNPPPITSSRDLHRRTVSSPLFADHQLAFVDSRFYIHHSCRRYTGNGSFRSSTVSFSERCALLAADLPTLLQAGAEGRKISSTNDPLNLALQPLAIANPPFPPSSFNNLVTLQAPSLT